MLGKGVAFRSEPSGCHAGFQRSEFSIVCLDSPFLSSPPPTTSSLPFPYSPSVLFSFLLSSLHSFPGRIISPFARY